MPLLSRWIFGEQISAVRLAGMAAIFVAAGLLKDVADLYRLKREEVTDLPGQGELSTENLFSAIEASKERSMSRLLAALGIRHVG